MKIYKVLEANENIYNNTIFSDYIKIRNNVDDLKAELKIKEDLEKKIQDDILKILNSWCKKTYNEKWNVRWFRIDYDDYNLIIGIHDKNNKSYNSITLKIDEIEDVLSYITSPETYIDRKNYNI